MTLLIIFNDGSKWMIQNVQTYICEGAAGVFHYRKNNHASYIPVRNVKYFGPAENWNEDN